MTSWVEVNDEGLARSAAASLVSFGEQLNDGAGPPMVDWGDDKFGQTMRTAYYETQGNRMSLPTECLAEKSNLGVALGEVGEGVTKALSELLGEEAVNHAEINRIVPPNV